MPRGAQLGHIKECIIATEDCERLLHRSLVRDGFGKRRPHIEGDSQVRVLGSHTASSTKFHDTLYASSYLPLGCQWLAQGLQSLAERTGLAGGNDQLMCSSGEGDVHDFGIIVL